MQISKNRVLQISTNLTEALLTLGTVDPNINTVLNRLRTALSILHESEFKTPGAMASRCPKCDAQDILKGNGDDPNHCTKCHHKWGGKDDKNCKHESILFKAPEVLASINSKPKYVENGLETRLDKVFANL